jgi:chemotaxis protein MotA
MADHELMEFLCDYLRLVISGNTDPFEIEALMDHEIETIRHEAAVPQHSLAGVADALPALGIVAAVMGVVHALASANLPPDEMGALYSMFLMMLAYGFVTPLSTVIEQKVEEGMKVYQQRSRCREPQRLRAPTGCGVRPQVLFSTERPSFTELDDHVREVKAR